MQKGADLAAFAFSADPITKGHEDLVAQAADRSDLSVIVATSAEKASRRTFSLSESVHLVRQTVGHLVPGERVRSVDGSLARHMRKEGIGTLYRGVRNVVDEAYEESLGFFYQSEFPEMKIVRLKSDPNVAEVSSSAVKELVKIDHDVANFVRSSVKAALESRILGQYPVAVTGGTGAGKSEFCRKMVALWGEWGIPVHHVDFDSIGHEILSSALTPEPMYRKVREKIAEAFPGTALPDGSIDRKALGKAALPDPEGRKTLDSIMSEPLSFRYRDRISGLKGILLVDAALIAEHGKTHFSNHTGVIVTAEDGVRADRLGPRYEKAGNPLSREEVIARILAQAPDSEKRTSFRRAISEEGYGMLSEFDGTSPEPADYRDAFFGLLSGVDVFGELRSQAALRHLGADSRKIRDAVLRLRQRYDVPGRHYHVWRHVVEALGLAFDPKLPLSDSDRAVLGAAILYHDAVMDFRIREIRRNERKSADLAEKELSELSVREEDARRVFDLVLSTCESVHSEAEADPLSDYMRDIDRAVLGADPSKYALYAEDVRREYEPHYGASAYREGRSAFLRRTVESVASGASTVYRTELFRSEFELQAIENMKRELSLLGG